MNHQTGLEKLKYRNWVRGGLAYKYLKEGIEGFADDVVQQEHKRILSAVNHTPGLVCSQCCLGNLQPKHQFRKDHAGRKKCPWGQKYCNCMYQNKQRCPNKMCESIMEEILICHGSNPPSAKWENTDIQKWCSSPWEIGKCFINAPGYSKATKAADIDASGLLHVFINNKSLHSHLSCNMSGKNIFIKTRERRNMIFHSPTMEMEGTELNECIDDIIDILEDSEELNARHDAQQAASKLKQLKQQDFIITTHNEVEVCRAALASINKKSDELKQSIIDAKDDIDMKQEGATKAIDDKMQTVLQDALEALANHSDIQTLKQAVELLTKRVNGIESDNKAIRQGMSLIKQRLSIIENNIDILAAAREETTKKLKYAEEKKALQNGLVKLYQQHYVKTSILPLNSRENDVSINEVYVSPKMAVDVQKCTGGKDRKEKTRTTERMYIQGYREIFQTNRQTNKSIYIVGDVGTGKSSFCQMMIQNWCTAFTDTSNNSVDDENNITDPGTIATDEDTGKSDTSVIDLPSTSKSGSDDNAQYGNELSSDESESDDNAQYSNEQSSDKFGSDDNAQYGNELSSDESESDDNAQYSNEQSSDKFGSDDNAQYSNEQSSDESESDDNAQYSNEQSSDKFGSDYNAQYSVEQTSDESGSDDNAQYSDEQTSDESGSDDNAQYGDEQSSDASGGNINVMRNFDFLFFIPLQRMSRYIEITDMVKATTANLTSRDMIENIFQQDSERCLILVDGLDEWAPRQHEYPLPHVSSGLPDRGKTNQATCVTLSRPSAKGVLNMKCSEYDHKVELLGITVKSVKCFIDQYLSKIDRTNVSSKAFMKKVRQAKLKHLQKTPLLLQQLLWLYCTENEIGTSVSDTYSHLLNTILRWAENKFELEDMVDQTSVTTEGKDMQLPQRLQRFPACETYKRFLFSLSRVAFETMTSDMVSSTFGRSYLRKKGVSKDDVTVLIKSGILVEENCYDPTKENTKLEFIHISYLEFFAAVHVSSHSNEDQQTMNTLKDLFLKCKSAADTLQLSNILKMICGLSPFLIPELSTFILEIVSRDESMLKYRNCPEMYSEAREIQRLVFNCLSECDSDDQPMVSLCDVIIDGRAKMSFIQRIIQEHVLSLYVSDEVVWRWVAGLKQLQYMYICYNRLCHSEMVLLSSLIQETPLKCLSLYSVHCAKSDCEGHNIDLSKHEQLRKLELRDCDAVKISSINTKHLEMLWLGSSNISDFSLLLNASILTELHLGYLPLLYYYKYTKKVKYVVHTLQQLRELKLGFTDIADSALIVTLEMRNLEHIELERVRMSLQTWCTFVDSLLSLQQSVYLETINCSVCKEMNGDGRNYVRQTKMFEVIKDDWWYFNFRTKK